MCAPKRGSDRSPAAGAVSSAALQPDLHRPRVGVELLCAGQYRGRAGEPARHRRVQRDTGVRLMNCETPRQELKRAVPPVGITWLGPAT